MSEKALRQHWRRMELFVTVRHSAHTLIRIYCIGNRRGRNKRQIHNFVASCGCWNLFRTNGCCLLRSNFGKLHILNQGILAWRSLDSRNRYIITLSNARVDDRHRARPARRRESQRISYSHRFLVFQLPMYRAMAIPSVVYSSTLFLALSHQKVKTIFQGASSRQVHAILTYSLKLLAIRNMDERCFDSLQQPFIRRNTNNHQESQRGKLGEMVFVLFSKWRFFVKFPRYLLDCFFSSLLGAYPPLRLDWKINSDAN